MGVASRVMPGRHFGNGNVFLEIMFFSDKRDELVIDYENRMDDTCLGA